MPPFVLLVVMLVPLAENAHTAGIGDTCMYKTDCRVEYAICYNREECRCQTNYTLEPKTGHCVPQCYSDKGCPKGVMECMAATCKCDKHYIKLNERCLKRNKVHLGEKCKDVDDCLPVNTSEVQCLDNICSCGNGYKHVGNDVCLLGHLGATCNKTNECDAENGLFCSRETCQCRENYVESKLRKTCLKLAVLNQPCEEHHQCTGNNTECNVTRCQCKNGYRPEHGKCIRNADLGEDCTTNEECNPLRGATHCYNGKCDCRAPVFIKSTEKHNSCVRVSKYGTFCEEQIQCPGSSKCKKGKCDCDIGLYWSDDMTCQPDSARQMTVNVWLVIAMMLIFSIC